MEAKPILVHAKWLVLAAILTTMLWGCAKETPPSASPQAQAPPSSEQTAPTAASPRPKRLSSSTGTRMDTIPPPTLTTDSATASPRSAGLPSV